MDLSRRYKVMYISRDDMMKLITGEIRITNIPEYTKIREVQERMEYRGWAIIIEHPSFPEVPEGTWCDPINLEIEQTNKEFSRKLYFG